jgi:hypothetical protein
MKSEVCTYVHELVSRVVKSLWLWQASHVAWKDGTKCLYLTYRGEDIIKIYIVKINCKCVNFTYKWLALVYRREEICAFDNILFLTNV